MANQTTTKNKQRRPQLWLALRFNQLPLNVHTYNETPLSATFEQAVVVCEKYRVSHLTHGAQKMGISPKMPIATAQALGKVQQLERVPEKEQKAILHLQDICYRFTPYIETTSHKNHGDQGLLLEISRCLKLFGGIEPFCSQLESTLQRTPYEYQSALGHTKHAAWLLTLAEVCSANQESAITTIKTYKAPQWSNARALFINQLNCLPIIVFREHEKAMESLHKTGFNTLEDVYLHIQRSSLNSLSKRMGIEFGEYLAKLYDTEQVIKQTSLFTPPVKTYQPIETFCQHIQFDYPISNAEQLRHPMQQLLNQLQDFLHQRQQQIQCLYWHMFDIYQNKDSLTVNGNGLNGQHHSSQQLLELSCIQLENKSLAFEVDLLELECPHLQAIQSKNQTLAFDRKKNNASSNDFELTLARLQSRLGENAIHKISACDHHIPEHTNLCIPVDQTANTQLTHSQRQALRPSWLLHTPTIIHLRNRVLYWYGELQLLHGPERIEGYWWDEPTARDYFVAQREDGVRVWVFYDLFVKKWFVQGVF